MAKNIRILNRLLTDVWCIRPEIHSQLLELAINHAKGIKAEGIEDLVEPEETPILEKVGDVAVVNIIGVIGQHLSMLEKVCGGTDTDEISDALEQAVTDSSVKAIVLYVDSCGGCVTGVPELAELVKAATKIKPVFAVTDSQACSAAYWIMSGADEIFATQSAVIGSIGAYMAITDYSKAYDMAGMQVNLFASGTYKGAGVEGTALTNEQKANFAAGVNKIAQTFKDCVKSSRQSVKDESMQGQCFYGDEGLTAGLVDGIKSVDAVIAYANK